MERGSRGFAGLLGIVALVSLGTPARAQSIEDSFRQSCFGCHTIGGGTRVGPDLKNVFARKDKPWLRDFILDPMAAINAGDPYALKLVKESGGKVMSSTPGMTKDLAEKLLDFIQAESERPKSQFQGIQLDARPLRPEDSLAGHEFFTGQRRFENGAPACFSCHTVNKLGLVSGGRLGPDLSRSFESIGGREALSAWLSAPASPTMAPVYRNKALEADEILSLVAYLNDCNQEKSLDQSPIQAHLVFFAVIGAGLILWLMDTIWKKRFRGVRRSLVEKQRVEVMS